MQYLPIFLLFMAALIAGYFYLQRAKARDAMSPGTTTDSAHADGALDQPSARTTDTPPHR